MIDSIGDLSRSEPVKPDMGTNEIEKEDENRDSRVSTVEIVKAAFGFVPRLEAVVERFDEIDRNIVGKTLNTNVVSIREERLDRDFVCRVAVGDDRARRP